MNKGSFSATNQPKKRRGKAPVTAAKKLLLDNQVELTQALIDAALSGKDSLALTTACKCLVSPAKPQNEPIRLNLSHCSSITEKAEALLDAIADGTLAPDTGGTLIRSVSEMVKIAEFDELSKRLSAIEDKLNAND